jgi:hypothetical protein
VEEAGFSFVESLGMKGVGQFEKFIIQMVAEFVQERPEEGTEGNDLVTLGSAHPHRDHGRGPSLGRHV